jgi:hypothetical protein
MEVSRPRESAFKTSSSRTREKSRAASRNCSTSAELQGPSRMFPRPPRSNHLVTAVWVATQNQTVFCIRRRVDRRGDTPCFLRGAEGPPTRSARRTVARNIETAVLAKGEGDNRKQRTITDAKERSGIHEVMPLRKPPPARAGTGTESQAKAEPISPAEPPPPHTLIGEVAEHLRAPPKEDPLPGGPKAVLVLVSSSSC